MSRIELAPTLTHVIAKSDSSPAFGSAPRVVSIAFSGDDAELAAALRRGDPRAPAVLYDRHAPRLRRVLARVLGADTELGDVLHETFIQALNGIARLEDDQRLGQWLTAIAVYTARGWIRRRQRWRWLRRESAPRERTYEEPHGAREALAQMYGILARMPVEERIVFALRHVDGMPLDEVANATDVSLATAKRRLRRARERFHALAHDNPALQPYLGGER